MAREETTSDQVTQLAEQVIRIGSSIRDIADQIKASEIPNVRLHLGTIKNILIPQLQHWLDVASTNANDDMRSFERGLESKSVKQKRYNEKRAITAAKKSSQLAKRVSRSTKKPS